MEYLLLLEFHLRKFILPDKLSQKEKEKEAGKRKAPVQVDTDVQPDFEDGDNCETASDNATGERGKKGPASWSWNRKGVSMINIFCYFNSLYPSIIQVHLTSFEPNSAFSMFA